jgi:hypothetical protein
MSVTSATELVSRLNDRAESQEAELEIVKLELRMRNLEVGSLQAKLDFSQDQIDLLKRTLHVEQGKFQRTHTAKLASVKGHPARYTCGGSKGHTDAP